MPLLAQILPLQSNKRSVPSRYNPIANLHRLQKRKEAVVNTSGLRCLTATRKNNKGDDPDGSP
jgi:hypothetical protein